MELVELYNEDDKVCKRGMVGGIGMICALPYAMIVSEVVKRVDLLRQMPYIEIGVIGSAILPGIYAAKQMHNRFKISDKIAEIEPIVTQEESIKKLCKTYLSADCDQTIFASI